MSLVRSICGSVQNVARRRRLTFAGCAYLWASAARVQLMLATALELSLSTFQPPGDRGSKAASEALCKALAGVSADGSYPDGGRRAHELCCLGPALHVTLQACLRQP